MTMSLDELVTSLLYEGYALYPYTPGATKNATPTPFGIVYPPAYAAECPGGFDHARLECVAEPGDDSELEVVLRYLIPTGERHEATERKIELGPVAPGERQTRAFEGGRLTLRSEWLDEDGRLLVRCCVHNTAEAPAGLDRAAALRHAFISTLLVLSISGGKFLSPLETGRESVNTYPVLATAADDAVLGAAIVLPDHPQLAPESRGALFDNTEIEEALLLHIHSLTDQERAQARARDPVVGEMLERALALGPEELMSLHGGLKDVPSEPGAQADDNPGEERATVDGVTFERGTKLVLKPGVERDPYDRMLYVRRATLERIYVDYDDRVHLAVTVDDDPGQQLMRETGRYLFFRPGEVQLSE